MKKYIKSLFLLYIPLLLIAGYAMSEFEFKVGDFVIEKADLPWLPRDWWRQSANPSDTVVADTCLTAAITVDTIPAEPRKPRWQQHMEDRGDSIPRILFFGDSMLEGLTRRCADYANEMGYNLTGVVWYSSTSEIWAKSDTLEYFIRKVNPDYLIVCLCSNELFVRNLNARDGYIANIVSRIKDYDYIWISPPNWKEDTGINDLIIKNVGKDHYFDSRHLELARSRDGAHPTFQAAEGWFDLVVDWMKSDSCAAPIPMPDEHAPVQQRRRFKLNLLQPVK